MVIEAMYICGLNAILIVFIVYRQVETKSRYSNAILGVFPQKTEFIVLRERRSAKHARRGKVNQSQNSCEFTDYTENVR